MQNYYYINLLRIYNLNKLITIQTNILVFNPSTILFVNFSMLISL